MASYLSQVGLEMGHLRIYPNETGMAHNIKVSGAYGIKPNYGGLRPSVEYGSSYPQYPVTGFVKGISGCPFKIGPFLNMMFGPFGCCFDTVPAAFHDQDTLRDNLVKSSQKLKVQIFCLA